MIRNRPPNSEGTGPRLRATITMVDPVWADILRHYPGIGVDAAQVMPNHNHGVVVIGAVGVGPCARPNDQPEHGRPRGAAPPEALSLSDVMERFKSLTTEALAKPHVAARRPEG